LEKFRDVDRQTSEKVFPKKLTTYIKHNGLTLSLKLKRITTI